jgi:hypothetical protein
MATEKSLHRFNQGLNLEGKNKYFRTKKKSILEKVNLETYRILKCLNFPISLKYLIIEKFMNFWSALNPGSKYRNFEILVPITIYYVLKSKQFSLKEKELLELSKITNKEFSTFKQNSLSICY